MKVRRLSPFNCGLVLVVVINHVLGAAPPNPLVHDWTRQFGTPARDVGFAVYAALDGTVFVGGESEGPIVESNQFSTAFLAKYSSSGSQLWIRQIDSAGSDVVHSIVGDHIGNVYVAGSTGGDLGGGLGVSTDAFVRKYDSNGTLLWTRELDSGEADYGGAAAVDEFGNVYISGATLGAFDGFSIGPPDAFVAKFSSNGDKLWVRQYGTTASDGSAGLASDTMGGIYVTGVTTGNFGESSTGSRDMYIRKYDYNGEHLWTRQFGTAQYDENSSVSADTLGNIFVAGYSEQGPFGLHDGIIAKFDSAGQQLWMRQLGTSELEWVFGVAADGRGNAYIAGTTEGDLEGSGQDVRASDLFVSKYDSAGNLLFTKQLVTPSSFEFSRGISTDGGVVYVGGEAFGNFGPMNAGNDDVFVVKFIDTTPIPEPTTSLLFLGAALICGTTRLID